MTTQSRPSLTPWGVRDRGAGLLREQADGGTGDLVPPAEDLTALGLGAGREDGLQQPAHDVEGDAVLLLAAAGEQHGAAAGGGHAPDLGQHGRLAQPGGRAVEQQPALPVLALLVTRAEPVHRDPRGGHLVLALVQEGSSPSIVSAHDGGPPRALPFRHVVAPPDLPVCREE
ncbi:hypothetical protein [Streptomyces thermogriseus]|uniref:Uncharacterized protein n=1 Tax=Streptomyces thermogriseus TaxID=75292 RepID=A0ABN1SZS5_9ACTN